jgi:hypothetical protein
MPVTPLVTFMARVVVRVSRDVEAMNAPHAAAASDVT